MSNPIALSTTVKSNLRQQSTKWAAFDGAVYDKFLSSIINLEIEASSSLELSSDTLPDMSGQPTRMILVDDDHIAVVSAHETCLHVHVLSDSRGMWDVVPMYVVVGYDGKLRYVDMFPSLTEETRVRRKLNSGQPILDELAKIVSPCVSVGVAASLDRSGLHQEVAAEPSPRRKKKRK